MRAAEKGVGRTHQVRQNMVNKHYFQNGYFVKLAPVLAKEITT
jgi:hypothetical protein